MEFWSVEYMATLAGAIAVTKVLTTVICNNTQALPAKQVALIVAFAVQVFVWLAQVAAGAPLDWVTLALAIFNAALVYLGAVGTNAITASMVLAHDAETFAPESASAVGSDLERAGSARWF
jgi:hypothetical protein